MVEVALCERACLIIMVMVLVVDHLGSIMLLSATLQCDGSAMRMRTGAWDSNRRMELTKHPHRTHLDLCVAAVAC